MTAIGELNADGVDLVETVVLEYEGGRRAVLNINGKIKLCNNATVVGTKGQATVGFTTIRITPESPPTCTYIYPHVFLIV